jgi:quinol monooxygenase YgiN
MGELADAVRARHAGNSDYRLSIDTEDPRVLHLAERWDRLESFVAHGKTPEVADIVQIVNPHGTESMEILRYEVAAELTA